MLCGTTKANLPSDPVTPWSGVPGEVISAPLTNVPSLARNTTPESVPVGILGSVKSSVFELAEAATTLEVTGL